MNKFKVKQEILLTVFTDNVFMQLKSVSSPVQTDEECLPITSTGERLLLGESVFAGQTVSLMGIIFICPNFYAR